MTSEKPLIPQEMGVSERIDLLYTFLNELKRRKFDGQSRRFNPIELEVVKQKAAKIIPALPSSVGSIILPNGIQISIGSEGEDSRNVSFNLDDVRRYMKNLEKSPIPWTRRVNWTEEF